MPRELGFRGEGDRVVLFEGGRLRVFVLLLVTTVLMAIQNVLNRYLPVTLDVTSLVIVYLALESRVISGAVLALLIGYLGDLASGESRGLVSASAVFVFLVLRLSVVRLTGARFLPITAMSALAALASLFVRLGIETVVGPGQASFAGMSGAILDVVLGAALFGYPCYRLLRSVDDRFRTREDEVTIRSFTPRRS